MPMEDVEGAPDMPILAPPVDPGVEELARFENGSGSQA
jgi:hypothetical protein